jgi:hypothetical protein
MTDTCTSLFTIGPTTSSSTSPALLDREVLWRIVDGRNLQPVLIQVKGRERASDRFGALGWRVPRQIQERVSVLLIWNKSLQLGVGVSGTGMQNLKKRPGDLIDLRTIRLPEFHLGRFLDTHGKLIDRLDYFCCGNRIAPSRK